MKERAVLQSLDVSACTGIKEEGLIAIASLTQLTALDASGLVNGREAAAALSFAVSFLSSLTGEESMPNLRFSWQSDSRHEHIRTH